MRPDDLTRLEAAVRSANPVPPSVDLVGSEESTAMALLVKERRDPMASTHTPQQLRPARIGHYRAWAFVAAFILILVGIGVLTLLLRGGGDVPLVDQPDESATPTTVAQPVEEPGESATPTTVAEPVEEPGDAAIPTTVATPAEEFDDAMILATVQMGPVTWSRVDTGDVSISKAVPLGDGFLATTEWVLGDPGEETGGILTSSDGVVWTPIADRPFVEGEMFGLDAGGPWGAIGQIVGAVDGQPGAQLVFIRPDGSWVRSDPVAEVGAPLGPVGESFDAVAVGEHGILLAYSGIGQFAEGELGEIAFLASPDGERWEIIEAPEGLTNVFGLTGTPFGPMLSGDAEPGGQPSYGKWHWLAADGRSWEEVTVASESFGTVDLLPEPWGDRVAYLETPCAAAGEPCWYQLYRTENGTDWSEMDMTPFGENAPYAIRGGEIGLLGFNDTEIMFTADGTEWTIAEVGTVFGTGWINWGGLAGGTDRFVVPFNALIGDFETGTEEPQLWIGTIEG